MHLRHAALRLLVNELSERYRAKKTENMLVEIGPQIVSDAFVLIATVFPAAALRRVKRLVDRENDVGDRYPRHVLAEAIAAARAAHAVDQRAAAQLAEQLLEIRQRDFLAG